MEGIDLALRLGHGPKSQSRYWERYKTTGQKEKILSIGSKKEKCFNFSKRLIIVQKR